jgi:hypothetical protein
MDILDITVSVGDNSPLICIQRSAREAELREIEDARKLTMILFQIILILTGEQK